jgi:hypothetical protein
MSRPSLLHLAVGIAALAGDVGRAEPRAPDFSPELEPWNGLGYLVRTAEEANVALTASGDLDLGDLRPGDLVVAVQPAALPEPAQLMAFIEAGGMLVLATEGPRHTATLEALGLTRHAPPTGFATTSTLTAPRRPEPTDVRAGGAAGFLFFRANALALNHPEALEIKAMPDTVAEPALSFPETPDRHVVVEVRLGLGVAVVISDASALVNDMQRIHYGNKQFAANLMRYLCNREPCSGRLLTGFDRLHGRFDQTRTDPTTSSIRDNIERINRIAAELSRAVAEPPLAWPIAAILGLSLLPTALALRARQRAARLAVDPPALGDGFAPPVVEALGLSRRRGSAEFGPAAQRLVATALASLQRRRDRSPLPQLVEDAAARLSSDRARLEGLGPQGISAERFERMHGDAETILAHVNRSRHRR